MSVLYADASALVKLLVREPESAAVAAVLADGRRVVASALVAVELACVARRRGLGDADSVLQRLDLLTLDAATLHDARTFATTPPLRALDAVHLAAARRVAVAVGPLELLCYDADLCAAARAAGLAVIAPA